MGTLTIIDPAPAVKFALRLSQILEMTMRQDFGLEAAVKTFKASIAPSRCRLSHL
jgi:hypothetical protein